MDNTQRNRYDVAIELLQLHIQLKAKHGEVLSADKIEELFKKYYTLVDSLPR